MCLRSNKSSYPGGDYSQPGGSPDRLVDMRPLAPDYEAMEDTDYMARKSSNFFKMRSSWESYAGHVIEHVVVCRNL